MHEHEAHLQEDLELARNDLGIALRELLGAVATLEEEAVAAGGLGQLAAQRLDLPGGDERRQAAELAHHRLERRGRGVLGLLERLPGVP